MAQEKPIFADENDGPPQSPRRRGEVIFDLFPRGEL